MPYHSLQQSFPQGRVRTLTIKLMFSFITVIFFGAFFIINNKLEYSKDLFIDHTVLIEEYMLFSVV